MASSPFAADPDCLQLALRIIKQGVPDMSETQMRRIVDPESRERFEKITKCRKEGGIDFACFLKNFAEEEHREWRLCWTKHNRQTECCLNEIYAVCDKMRGEWSALILSGIERAKFA